MICLDHVTKTYGRGKDAKCVLNDISCIFECGQNVGILGANGSGKSTLLRILAGGSLPNSGRVIRRSRVSWPLAFSGCFQGSLNGEENTRFVSRIYGVDHRVVVKYVEAFSELGNDFYRPIQTYSTGMRARLGFGLSLALHFDFYLIDEVTAVGDISFQKKSKNELRNRLNSATVIMVSHNPGTIRQYCTHATILSGGKLGPILPLNQVVPTYNKLMGV